MGLRQASAGRTVTVVNHGGGVFPGCYCWNMCGLRWCLLSLVVSLICMTGMTSEALTPLIHMTNHCHKTVSVNESLILDLTENLMADRVLVGHLSCAVTLQAEPGARLYLHVLQLAISDKANMPDRLHIYEVSNTGTKTRRLTPSTGLYGVLERPFLIYNTAGIIVPDFRSAGPRMRLDYQGKPTIIYRGFRVLVTVFYSPNADGLCRTGTFHCPYAGTCIPVHVRCDTLPNCGLDDNSDERHCQREDVVTNLIEEYATRTAVIAGVTGALVFLGMALLVLLVIVKRNRTKHNSGTDQSVHYTARGGGACRYKNETDLTRLYAPPSYEDVMNPSGEDNSRHPSRHRHCGPPPAYSAAVAALIHKEGDDSSEDEASRVSRGSHHRHRSSYVQTGGYPQSFELTRLRGAGPADSDEDVRMHGTWPSDTDEEEEVRARRRRKGGKCKGKSRQNSAQSGSAPSSNKTAPSKVGETKKRLAASPGHENTHLEASTPVKAPSPLRTFVDEADASSSLSAAESHSDCSPSHQACPSAASGNSRGGETISETESQLASSKRNSRTESNSPCDSSSSIHSNSPAEQPAAAETMESCRRENSHDDDDLQLHHHHSPSAVRSAKCTSRTPSEESLSLKPVVGLNGELNEDRFVDLNPSGL